MGQKHHLVLGRLTDFLTGQTLEDTHDERYRQSLARLLVETRGFAQDEVRSRIRVTAWAGDKKALVPLDFLVVLDGRPLMAVKYGPGSLVTRRRPALAAARLAAKGHVPVVVVTNGENAEVLDGINGKVTGEGLEAVWDKNRLAALLKADAPPLSPKRLEMEARILYAFEVDNACPCDDTVCRLEF